MKRYLKKTNLPRPEEEIAESVEACHNPALEAGFHRRIVVLPIVVFSTLWVERLNVDGSNEETTIIWCPRELSANSRSNVASTKVDMLALGNRRVEVSLTYC
jgi:hypothetical protein